MHKSSIKLANGISMPLVGLGTFLSKDPQVIPQLIRSALDAGYRHIDTAVAYDNHKMLGDALAEIFNEGKYKREDIFITTKVNPCKEWNALDILQKSLKDLRLEYVDLFLVHWPVLYSKPPVKINHKPQHSIWYEMEECYKQKLTRAIGVSNYNVQSLSNILSLCSIPPVVNQVEMHVYLQQPGLVKFCKEFDIALTAYAPLARGGAGVVLQLGDKLDLFNDPILIEIAKKHKKAVGQIALHYLVQQGISVIPKTEKAERLSQNLNIFDFQLSEQELKQIQSLDKNIRSLSPAQQPEWGYLDVFA